LYAVSPYCVVHKVTTITKGNEMTEQIQTTLESIDQTLTDNNPNENLYLMYSNLRRIEDQLSSIANSLDMIAGIIDRRM